MTKINKLLIPISISLFLVVYGINRSKILYSNSIIAKIPNDCTTPDFEVVFGKFKIGSKPILKHQIVDKDFIWIKNYDLINKAENADDPYMHDYYYILEGEIIGYDSESDDPNYKIINPKLKLNKVELISKFNFIGYIIITLLCLTFTIIKIKGQKELKN